MNKSQPTPKDGQGTLKRTHKVLVYDSTSEGEESVLEASSEEDDPGSVKARVKCRICRKKNIQCVIPDRHSGLKACNACRYSKKKCEYPNSKRPRLSSSRRKTLALRRSEPEDQGTPARDSGTSKSSLASDSDGPSGLSPMPMPHQRRSHLTSSWTGPEKYPRRIAPSSIPASQFRLCTPPDSSPPPRAAAAVALEDLLDRTKESLLSLKVQYEDTTRARTEALLELKKSYFRLQNSMGAVTSNLHELEEVLFENLQVDKAGPEKGFEAFQKNFVGLHAELRDIEALRVEHDRTVKQYKHLEDLSRKHCLDGGMLERLALQTKGR